MTALELAANARRRGVRFVYREDGTITLIGTERLSAEQRSELLLRIDDVRAVIAEQSIPNDVRPVDVIDRARAIVRAGAR